VFMCILIYMKRALSCIMIFLKYIQWW
jgi:hypothetical protein